MRFSSKLSILFLPNKGRFAKSELVRKRKGGLTFENIGPLTLSRVAPSAVSKGWGGLIGPPHVSKGVGVVLVSNFSCSLRSDQD